MYYRQLIRLAGISLGLSFACVAARAQAPGQDQAPPQSDSNAEFEPLTQLEDLLDRLPDFNSLNLPMFVPPGVTFHSSPHFGDLVRRGYFRVPGGVRLKWSRYFQAHLEIEGYFAHGLRKFEGDASHVGFNRLHTGVKYETPNPIPTVSIGEAPKPMSLKTAYSAGLDFSSPLSHPPLELSDGFRHTIPFVAMSRVIVPDWRLLGYGSVGADLISRANLPINFGRNQLHSNSLIFSAGLARDFPKFRTSLTGNFGTTSLISNENHHVFGLRPAIVFPLPRLQGRHTRLLVTVGGWSIWGPDGHELGASASLRVDFRYRPGARKP